MSIQGRTPTPSVVRPSTQKRPQPIKMNVDDDDDDNPKVKVNKLDVYQGDHDRLNDWLIQMNMYFNFNVTRLVVSKSGLFLRRAWPQVRPITECSTGSIGKAGRACSTSSIERARRAGFEAQYIGSQHDTLIEWSSTPLKFSTIPTRRSGVLSDRYYLLDTPVLGTISSIDQTPRLVISILGGISKP